MGRYKHSRRSNKRQCNKCDDSYDGKTPTYTSYVKGGAAVGGDGSRKKPYNSLADAQADATWKTLVVLKSDVALDGGITLRADSKLVGEVDYCKKNCDALPVITNTTSANGGNGVVVVGDATIENLHIKTTLAAGIEYSQGRNLRVINVCVSEYNSNGVLTPLGYPVGGISGSPALDGKTFISKVRIFDNFNGAGVLEVAGSVPVTRSVKVVCSDIYQLQTLLPIDPLDPPAVLELLSTNGVLVLGGASTYKLYVKHSRIHDFLADAVPGNLVRGVHTDAQETHIEKVKFLRLHNFNEATFATNTRHVNAVFSVAPETPLVLTVTESYFKELVANTLQPVTAVHVENVGGTLDLKVKCNTFNNVFTNIQATPGLNAVETHYIAHNCGSAADVNYTVLSSGTVVDPDTESYPTVKSKVVGNNFKVGGSEFNGSSLVVGTGYFEAANNFAAFEMQVEDNCLDGQNAVASTLGNAPIAGINFAAPIERNAQIIVDAGRGPLGSKGNNNFVRFANSLIDIDMNASYVAQNNWWGKDGAPAVATSADFIGYLDVTHPRCEPIKCPLKCSCKLADIQVPPPVTAPIVLPGSVNLDAYKLSKQ
jgi:hypothetical protein